LIAFLLCTSPIWSQSYKVTGEIIDETSNPVAYANILLLKAQDSTIVSGTTSNEDGEFKFDEILANSYILKTSFISYEDNYRNISVNNDLTVPSIILKESIEALSAIQITYRRPTIKREVDRLVFNVEKTALSEGNMMEVLRSTPRVLVLNNSITVMGATPTVYINDKKVHISSSEIIELLEGTSASNIKSVEVITNPPARYGAESGVVLNIIMSKSLVSGYSGSLFSNYTQGVFPKTNYGMSNYFKGSTVSFFANYSYNDKKVDRVERMIINYPDQEWDSDIDRNTWSDTHNFNFNFDWDINENNTFSISANTQFIPYSKSFITSNTKITPATNDDVANFFSENTGKEEKHNLGFDMGYAHTFKKDNAKLSINTHYTTYDHRQNQDVITDYFLGDNSFYDNNAFTTKANQDAEILTMQLDYVLPIGESSSFEIGAKFSNVKTDNDISQQDIVGNQVVLNLDNSDQFNYDETVNAAYVSFDKIWKLWHLSTGLRVEQTNIEAISVSTNQTNNQNYLEWFPTVSLGFQATEKVNIFTNLKRSISRPSYRALNPFKLYLSDNTFAIGNPNLKPIFTNSLSLGVSINSIFTVQAYYKKYENNIFEIPFQNNIDKTLAYTWANINYTEEIGLDLEAYFNIVERWSMYLGTSFYNYNDNATVLDDTVNRNMWSNYSIFQNNFSFLKDKSLTANFTLTYIHKSVIGLLYYDSRIDTNLSFRKTVFKGKGSLSLIFSDLFNRQDYFVTSKFLDQDNTLYDDFDTRYIKVGFRYSFGNTKLSTNERTSSSADERERLNNNK